MLLFFLLKISFKSLAVKYPSQRSDQFKRISYNFLKVTSKPEVPNSFLMCQMKF